MHRGEWGVWERNHMQWNEISSSHLEPQSLGVLKSEAAAPSLIQVWEEPVIKETVTKLLSLPTQPWSSLWEFEICGTLPLFWCLFLFITWFLIVSIHYSLSLCWFSWSPQLPELWWLLNNLGAEKASQTDDGCLPMPGRCVWWEHFLCQLVLMMGWVTFSIVPRHFWWRW